MDNLKNILLILLVFVVGFFVYDKFTEELTAGYITTTIEVPVPAKEGEIKIDSISYPVYIEVENPLNKKLVEEFTKTKDSLQKLKLYVDAITTRTYKETFKDSTQTIEVTSTVQGKLLEQKLVYHINPYTLPVEVTIPIETKNKFKVFAGAEVGLPLDGTLINLSPVVKGTLLFKNSKDNILSIGVDTRTTIWAGYFIKL